MSHNDLLITHDTQARFNLDTEIARLKTIKNPVLPQSTEIELLKQMHDFELGRFLLANQGLNGYWIAYCILYGLQQTNLSQFEHWFLTSAPVIMATRERFSIFLKLTEKYLAHNINIASIPCGTMDDLYGVNYGAFKGVNLVGIDLDQESLDLAQNSKSNQLPLHTQFLKKNAWALHIHNKFNLILSNGLNMYEPDNQKVVLLYKEFYKALRPEGKLITSFLTPPEGWRNYNADDLLKQTAIFKDILHPKFQSYRTEAETVQQLEQAGLQIVEIIYDKQAMYPTVVAKKI